MIIHIHLTVKTKEGLRPIHLELHTKDVDGHSYITDHNLEFTLKEAIKNAILSEDMYIEDSYGNV